MEKLNYTIEFFTYWHCGSGLAKGADVDLLVIKDDNGLPFVPGKTVKGLLKEAALELAAYGEFSDDDVLEAFGKEADEKTNSPSKPGSLSFSNAVLSSKEHDALVANNAQEYVYSSIASTAICPETGVAKDHSLRKMEVVVPCIVEGTIMNVDGSSALILKRAMKMVKRLGSNRNRGLGRCKFTAIEK